MRAYIYNVIIEIIECFGYENDCDTFASTSYDNI